MRSSSRRRSRARAHRERDLARDETRPSASAPRTPRASAAACRRCARAARPACTPTLCSRRRPVARERVRAHARELAAEARRARPSFAVRKLFDVASDVDRLEQVRLALPVVAGDDVEARPELEVDRVEVPEDRARCERLDRERPAHGARPSRGSDAHRHHDGEELPRRSPGLQTAGSSSPLRPSTTSSSSSAAEHVEEVLRVEADASCSAPA